MISNNVAMTHSPEIQQIDTVRAYYCGPRLIAEVDVVMNKDERVEVAHDVAEALQIKLEKLPSVERAYVHIDYETSHKPVSAPNLGGMCKNSRNIKLTFCRSIV